MSTTSSFQSNADGTRITTYTWAETPGQPVGVVQISHGLAEHGERYDRFARALNAAGFIVHAVDHRGHGRTAGDNLGDFGSAGFSGLIADVAQFGALLRAQHGPQLPLFLFGHSMGSFAAQAAIIDHSSTWSGVILSGSTALDLFAAAMANAPADAPPGSRPSTQALSTAPATNGCRATLPRSMPAWPTRGAGGTCRRRDPSLFRPAPRLADPAQLACIRSDLPILIASGDADPLAAGGVLLEQLGQRYRDAGVADVTVKLYPAARHEILNETNRDEF